MLSPDQVFLFEEHCSTLPVWWARRDRPRTVVYLDAHLDLRPVAPQAMASLQSCSSIEEVEALGAPHYLDTSPDYAFGIDNFLYAAHKLNLIERLIWVTPPHIPRTYTQQLIDYLQRVDGITFEELTGFEEAGPNVMRGNLMGLDITICDYDRLDAVGIGDEYNLDIDVNYFVRVPEDRFWIEPAIVISKIVDQLGEPSLVTISRSVESGFTPLAFRFVGDYIYSRFCRKSDQFKYYWRLSSAIQKLSRGKKEAGRKICEELTETNPEFAAAWYLLALISKDASERNRLLEEAASRDEKYRKDLARESISLLHRNKPLKHKRLQRLLDTLEDLELTPGEREYTEIALARTLAVAGNSAQAQQLLKKQNGAHAKYDEVMLAIAADRLLNEKYCNETWDMLIRVCDGYKNVTAANIYLGDLESAKGQYETALEHYREAHRRAPAWMSPLKKMLVPCQQLLMQREYDGLKEEIRQREQRLRQLMEDS